MAKKVNISSGLEYISPTTSAAATCTLYYHMYMHPSTGTVAEGAPIIPISAQLKYNIEVVCEYITKSIPIPVRDFASQPRLIGQ